MPMKVIGWAGMKVGFGKVKVIAGIRDNKELVHVVCLTSPVFLGGGVHRCCQQQVKCLYNIKIFKLILCIGVHGFGMLRLISTFFSVLVSGLYVHYHNFYCKFSYYLPLINPDLRYACNCSYY
jgi:hypothetical protein